LPRIDCESIIAEIQARGRRMTTELEAAQAVKLLLGMYPARQVHDAETYSMAMVAVFMAVEHDFVRRVVDPVIGLPSKLKYLPTVAEVTEALEAERAKREHIKLTAHWMLREHDRRKAEAEERAKWEKIPEEELERRRAQVAALIGGAAAGAEKP